MSADAAGVVVLFDVDDTLLDHDAVKADIDAALRELVGPDGATRYWALVEEGRAADGYVDYLAAVQRLRRERPYDRGVIGVGERLLAYPYEERVYPRVPEVLEAVRRWATPAILSDGDAVMQPRKIARAGLADLVGGAVLLTVHKDQELDAVARRFPAQRYVVVDDKPRLLAAIAATWGPRVTTVLVRQGHHAREQAAIAAASPPDVDLAAIGDLADVDLRAVVAAAGA